MREYHEPKPRGKWQWLSSVRRVCTHLLLCNAAQFKLSVLSRPRTGSSIRGLTHTEGLSLYCECLANGNHCLLCNR